MNNKRYEDLIDILKGLNYAHNYPESKQFIPNIKKMLPFLYSSPNLTEQKVDFIDNNVSTITVLNEKYEGIEDVLNLNKMLKENFKNQEMSYNNQVSKIR